MVSAQRDRRLIHQLALLVRGCALPRPLLVCMDALSAYLGAFRRALRMPVRTGKRGRSPQIPWRGIVLGQVIKEYQQRPVVGVLRRVVRGTARAAQRLLTRTQGGGVLNTAYVERLNGTYRARLALLVRRTRGLARREALLRTGKHLIGTVYNFCTEHAGLTLRGGGGRTPAMPAGIMNRCRCVADLLWHRVSAPRRQLPKRRGRRPKAIREMIAHWCISPRKSAHLPTGC